MHTHNHEHDHKHEHNPDQAAARPLRPLYDRVLVRRIKPDDRTKGGLYIPESAKKKPTEAIVLEVGKGALLPDGSHRPIGVKKGDKVLFGEYSGAEVKIVDANVLVLREDDILAVIED
jgi:chaperonin GroES